MVCIRRALHTECRVKHGDGIFIGYIGHKPLTARENVTAILYTALPSPTAKGNADLCIMLQEKLRIWFRALMEAASRQTASAAHKGRPAVSKWLRRWHRNFRQAPAAPCADALRLRRRHDAPCRARSRRQLPPCPCISPERRKYIPPDSRLR